MSQGITVANSLTSEQAQVAEQHVDSRSLVVAAAGTGKTHALVRRLEFLLDNDVSADQVLVLSFSRAAVRELSARTVASTGRGRFVTARTFDAWALDLLRHIYADQEWHEASFEERIEAAAGALIAGHAGEYTARIRHVLLDEIQDLVGPRLEMVQTLLSVLDCGFTVVGDPAQSIYGFQARGHGHKTGDIFTWVRRTYADLIELSLTHDFRARTPRPAGIIACGAALRTPTGSAGDDISRLVRGELADVQTVGSIDDILAGFEHFEGTCAILCRDNGQAMQASTVLHKASIAHSLQRRSGDHVSPRWLAALFRHHSGLTINRADFNESTGLTGKAQETVWHGLLATIKASNDRIDLLRLRTLVLDSRLPQFISSSEHVTLTVSSMHRAKGLEFDRVFLLTQDHRHQTDPIEEARLLYMAMTRCRDDLFRLDPLPMGGTYAGRCRYTDRWARFQFRHRGRRLGLAMEPGDVSRDFPAGAAAFPASPLELQEYLADEVWPGDAVTLTRIEHPADDDLAAPMYTVDHRGRPIGLVSQGFRSALARYKYGRKVPETNLVWPISMTSCWIDDVTTVAGSAASGRRAGLGDHGVWLAPQLTGLTWFQYESSGMESGNE